MSEVIGEGVVRIRTDETGVDVAGAGRRAGQGYVSGFGSSLKSLAGIIGVTLLATKSIDFIKESVAEGREAQKVGAATTQIIKATGGAAKISASQVSDLATAISLKTGIDDEAIQTGSNLLLTFKQVRNEVGKGNDVFNRATQSAVDLSAAGFGSVESASKTLGKALNDPVKGMSALSRAGVTFTQAQKDQVAALVESGDLLGAQKIILGEVEGQVGGVAAATATAGEKATVAWGNVKEQVGTALIPVLDTLLNLLVTKILPGVSGLISEAGKLGPVFSAIGGFIRGAFAGGETSGFFDTIKAAASEVIPLLIAGFEAVLPSVLELVSAIRDGLGSVLPIMAATFTGTVLPAIQQVGEYLVATVFPIFSQVAQIIATQVIPTIATLAAFFYGTLYPALVQIITAVAENLKPVFDQLAETFRTQILPTVQALVDQIRTQLIPALEPLIVKIVAVVGFLLKLAATILGVVLPPLIRLIGFILSNLIPAIVGIIVIVVKVINTLLSWGAAIGTTIGRIGSFGATIVNLVTGALTRLVNAVAAVPGQILALGSKFLEAGKTIIGKFLDGLKGVGSFASGIATAVYDAVKGVINSAIDRLNSLLEFTIHVGPKSFTVNPPDIGHLQSGTSSATAGSFLVGEVGPERVFLPTGARVLSAAATRQADARAIDYDALAQALVRAGVGTTVTIAPVLATGDPDAAAMAVMNRLAAAGVI